MPDQRRGPGRKPRALALTITEVYALADAIHPRYRVLVLLGTFASLRWAELAALRPADVDIDACIIRVDRQLIEQRGGGSLFGPPKSRAGRRIVPFPAMIQTELRAHLERVPGDRADVLVFTSPAGAPMRHSNFYRRAWLPAVAKAGLSGVHFHDLRHTGNTLTADAGANLRELMERMGHSSTRAALIYLHSSGERQRALADAVGEVARAPLQKPRQPGKHLARVWHVSAGTSYEHLRPTGIYSR